jgi:glycosyltransferase involved in cell wall biosynthesis
MRILMITQYFAPETGATSVRLGAITRELRRHGHEVELVTALPNYPSGRIFDGYRGRLRLTEQRDGMTLHRVWVWAAKGAGLGRVVNFLSFMAMALLPLRKVAKPDVIFVESPPFTTFLTGLAYRWRWPCVLLVFNLADHWIEAMRDMGLLGSPRLLAGLTRYARFCYRRADLVTTVTQTIVDDLVARHGVPADKLVLLPNGSDASTGPADDAAAERVLAPVLRPGQQLALCVGTHGYIHGMEVLLAAAADLADRPELVFLLVGDGSEKARLVELARARGLANLHFADPVPPAAVPALYRRAAVGLCTLRDVPIAKTVRLVRALNAMGAGVPVVYAGAGEGAELVRRTGAGLVTPPGDGPALAAAIRSLLADPAAARAMGQAGSAYLAAHLSWPAIVARFEEELRARLAARRQGGSLRPAGAGAE